MMITRGFANNGTSFDIVIKKYVDGINKEATFFYGYLMVDIQHLERYEVKNLLLINGMSDNVLKYIAEAGNMLR